MEVPDTEEALKEFSTKVATAIQEYLDKVPIHLLVKVLATHEVDLLAFHAEAIAEAKIKRYHEAVRAVSQQ